MMKRLLFLVAVLFATTAQAQTTVTRYVDTDCANNGDGTAATCAASAGAAGAYKTLAQAISDNVSERANLVTANEVLHILVAGTVADGCANINGFTTDATRFVRIACDPDKEDGCHPGTYSESHYRIACASNTGSLQINDKAVRVEGIQVVSTAVDEDRGRGITIGSACTVDCRIIGNLVTYKPAGTPTTSSLNNGITNEPNIAASQKIIVANNIVYDFKERLVWLMTDSGAGNELYIYNNTFVDCLDSGCSCLYMTAYGSTDTIKVRDNILQNCQGDDFYLESSATTSASAKNITEDATSPDGSTYQSKEVAFADETADDFHLHADDTIAADAGDDLSADGDYAFAVDIDGDERPQGSAWDIGADERAASGGGGGSVLRANQFNYGFNMGLNGGFN